MASFVQAERSALSGIVTPGHFGCADATGLSIVEWSDIAFASVVAKRGKRDALVSAVETAFGVALPQGPRRVTKSAITFAGTGPEQWIASGEVDGLAAKIRSRLGPFAAVTDQSDARLVLQLSGMRVRDVLAKGVPLDLHPKVFKIGDVATTLVAYIGVQIDRIDEATWQLTAPRSMAGSFWSWLSASAAEFGYDVVAK
jgi:heterotetrameric sarcosine oxidase gamma subunit